MASSFSWLDYSERERRAMLDVVDLFREQDTRDELGLAPVRDAFSDLFLPGTVVPQTRARYYLFVPWIYKLLEEEGVGSADIRRLARKREGELIKVLKRLPDRGVIGRQSGEEINRLPSSTYWPGLVRWRIFRAGTSLDDYHAEFSAVLERRRRHPRTDEKEPVGGPGPETWGQIPDAPPTFPAGMDFRLSGEEARYLQERIETSVPDTLLAWLVGHARAADRLRELAFVWEFGRIESASPDLRKLVGHAQCFSMAFHGAALLYNLLLARAASPRRTETEDRFAGLLVTWANDLRRWEVMLRAWNLDELWPHIATAGHRLRAPAREFVENWVGWLRSTEWNPKTTDDPVAARLVREREIRFKGAQSRFQNPNLLRIWGGDSGSGALTYRWGIARGILADIVEGLEGGA